MRMRATVNWLGGAALALAIGIAPVSPARADETCQSPFLPKVTGQEDYLYVWTLGVKGVADGNDAMVTVDVNPTSGRYGQIVHRAPVPGQHEAHHAGFTDDRRFLWAGGLDTSQIFIFDVASNPAQPKLVKTIKTFVKDTGGPGGPAHVLRAPGADADLGPVQRQGRRRPDRARRVQQRRPLHPDDLDARGGGLRLRRAGQRQPESHAHVVLRGPEELHAADRGAPEGRRGDEAVRLVGHRLGLPCAQAAPGALGSRRAARAPLGAAPESSRTPSPRPRSPGSSS